MKTKQVNSPRNSELSYELQDREIMLLRDEGVTKAVWWYETGCYDGAGYMVYKLKSGQYGMFNMGHCSCYGRLDRFQHLCGYTSLKELKKKCTEDLLNDLEPIFKGWK